MTAVHTPITPKLTGQPGIRYRKDILYFLFEQQVCDEGFTTLGLDALHRCAMESDQVVGVDLRYGKTLRQDPTRLSQVVKRDALRVNVYYDVA
jgi:hypothetical protein